MAHYKYLTVNYFLEKISKFPIGKGDWNESDIIEWIYDALEQINNTRNLIFVDLVLVLDDGKVRLPVDMYDIKLLQDEEGTVLEQAQGNMTLKNDKDYVINNGYLYSNNLNRLLLTYSTIPLDESGNPKIPDDPYFIKAIEAYLKLKVAEISYYRGNLLENQYRNLLQDWTFRLPGASSAGKMDIMNNLNRFKKIHQVHRF